MSEVLPCYLDGTEHPILIALVRAYKPHTQPDLIHAKQLQQENHCGMNNLCADIGLDYQRQIKTRKDMHRQIKTHKDV